MMSRVGILVRVVLVCLIACWSWGGTCTRCNPDFIGLNLTVDKDGLPQPDADSIDRLYFSASGPQTIDRFVTAKTPPFKFPVVVPVPTACIDDGTYSVTVTGYSGDTPIALGQIGVSLSDHKAPDTSVTLSPSVPTF